MIEALPRLGSDVVFVMIGYGSAQAMVENRAKALGVGERVHHLPPVPQAELLAYTADASVGVIPLLREKSHLYACPGKLFEYIGAGIPIVVSDMPNLKLIVEKYGIGGVFEAGNSKSAAEVLRGLLENGQTRQRCIDNVRKAHQSELNWEHQRQKLSAAVLGNQTTAGAS
jgi:glycosyltransferase involved in cell wall biosynthesis